MWSRDLELPELKFQKSMKILTLVTLVPLLAPVRSRTNAGSRERLPGDEMTGSQATRGT